MSILAGEKWEAPDRHFIGHRDCLVRNMSRYNFIAPHVSGRCLDIGCGRGYGFSYLKPHCSSCTGLDVSDSFLQEACAEFPDISFVKHSAEKLPFANASFDTITSFEVIEHIADDNAFLSEIVRVATPGALVAISTPNRLVVSGGRNRPLNQFHVREYVAEEFRNLLAKHFAEMTLYGQNDGNESSSKGTNALINRIPLRIKHLLPFYLQDVIGVMLRPRLKMEECRFNRDNFDLAHTIYALCRTAR
jgi:2-polyprenyl-3-methyl-5-hydroxy-6-metoxy-1,4-benzoquinol methylase